MAHRDLFVMLHLISSKIRLKYNEPQPEDYSILERALDNLDFLWKIANLSYTPKIYSILAHAMEQMKHCQGIGDMLEDNVEHMHQLAARIESCSSRMTNNALKLFIHLKVEAIQKCQEVKGKIELSRQHAKWAFKKRNPEVVSVLKNAKLKTERSDAD
jgi:hypothetical protein